MKAGDYAVNFFIKHPVWVFFLTSALLVALAVAHDSSRKNSIRENIATIQMNDDMTCYVYENSISCVKR